MEPTTGIEPVNLFLTKEALYLLSYVGLYHNASGAGDETRTRDIQLGRLKLYQLSYSRNLQNKWWWGEDLNLRRRMPTDLQSVPFGRSGTPPSGYNTMEPAEGLEPPTD